MKKTERQKFMIKVQRELRELQQQRELTVEESRQVAIGLALWCGMEQGPALLAIDKILLALITMRAELVAPRSAPRDQVVH